MFFIKKERLDSLFTKTANFSDDLELQAHWAKYLCILVSGFIESSIRGIFYNYAKSKSNISVSKFVENNLKLFYNPKMEKILHLTSKFNLEWERELRESTKGELKDSIDSIVANRNQIAHGENVNISFSLMRGYYNNAVKVINKIEDIAN